MSKQKSLAKRNVPALLVAGALLILSTVMMTSASSKHTTAYTAPDDMDLEQLIVDVRAEEERETNVQNIVAKTEQEVEHLREQLQSDQYILDQDSLEAVHESAPQPEPTFLWRVVAEVGRWFGMEP